MKKYWKLIIRRFWKRNIFASSFFKIIGKMYYWVISELSHFKIWQHRHPPGSQFVILVLYNNSIHNRIRHTRGIPKRIWKHITYKGTLFFLTTLNKNDKFQLSHENFILQFKRSVSFQFIYRFRYFFSFSSAFFF